MRAIIAIVALVLILALVGWVSFSTEPGRSSVNVETEKIERDIEGISESVEDASDEFRDSASGHSTDASP
ncbi:hypothetical protein [Botrimarina mediterranea]|uniref:hypothetical protein n=1 Tax=Botrimarina mediterranea TaxID=2528022 RepID=UPI001187F81E|nr:hypothetical protein K2D_38720 [Planctomycetes bacterium K2D]